MSGCMRALLSSVQVVCEHIYRGIRNPSQYQPRGEKVEKKIDLRKICTKIYVK
jgi:hypothetical protein